MASDMIKMVELKTDIHLIKEKIEEYKKNNIIDSFKIEMRLLEDLPEQYSNYPWLIKRLSKSTDHKYLDKFLESLEKVMNGEQSLASAELNLGLELKKEFIDPLIN